jgi:hypothetical protein
MKLAEIVEALSMAQDLPILLALPIYIIAYAAVAWMIAKAVEAWRRALK